MDSYADTLPRSFSDPIGDDDACLGDLVADSQTTEKPEDIVAERGRYAMQFLTQFERDVLEKRFNRKRGSIGSIGWLSSSSPPRRKCASLRRRRYPIRTIAAVD